MNLWFEICNFQLNEDAVLCHNQIFLMTESLNESDGNVTHYIVKVDTTQKNHRVLHSLICHIEYIFMWWEQMIVSGSNKQQKPQKKILRLTEQGISFVDYPEKFDASSIKEEFQVIISFSLSHSPTFFLMFSSFFSFSLTHISFVV